MARARVAKDKDPVDGQTEVREITDSAEYVTSDAVSGVIGDLFRSFGGLFSGLTQLSMEHLIRGGHYRTGGDVKLDGGIVRAYVIGKREHDLHGFDCGVWIRQHHWDRFTADQKHAALFHALCHFEVSESGALSTRPHTIESFDAEVREFGLWLPEHESIQVSLDLFATRQAETPKRYAAAVEGGGYVPATRGSGSEPAPH